MGQEFKINDCGEIIREGEAKTKKTNWWSIVSLLLFFVICVLSYCLYESYERIDALSYCLYESYERIDALYWQLNNSENTVFESTLEE